MTDLKTHGRSVFERFNTGADGTLWYYGALASVFARRMPGPLTRELVDAVQQMLVLADEPTAITR